MEEERQERARLDPFRDGPWALEPGEQFGVPQADCPACGGKSTRPIMFSLWFGLMPWLLNFWRCDGCGKRFSAPGPRLKRCLIVFGLASLPVLAMILISVLAGC